MSKITENQYSVIPTIRREMREHNLPEPELLDERGCFIVILSCDLLTVI